MFFLDHYADHKRDYQAFLFDIDGTLTHCGKIAPGAAELLSELRSAGTPYLVLTNDANHSTAEKSEILHQSGLDLPPEEILSCGDVLREFVEINLWQDREFFLLGDLGNPCFAERAGLRVCRDPNRIHECFGLLNGEGYYNWHDHMQAALNFLKRHPDAPFVVPNPDSYWPGRSPGSVGVGAGGQARFLCGLLREMGIEITPSYLGKPYRPIYDYAVRLLRERFPGHDVFEYAKILMLGDSLASDIRGANGCGMRSALLLTGITSSHEAALAIGERRPDMIFEALG